MGIQVTVKDLPKLPKLGGVRDRFTAYLNAGYKVFLQEANGHYGLLVKDEKNREVYRELISLQGKSIYQEHLLL